MFRIDTAFARESGLEVMQAGKSKPKRCVCAAQTSCAEVLTHLVVSKLQGLPPTYNNAPIFGKSTGDWQLFDHNMPANTTLLVHMIADSIDQLTADKPVNTSFLVHMIADGFHCTTANTHMHTFILVHVVADRIDRMTANLVRARALDSVPAPSCE